MTNAEFQDLIKLEKHFEINNIVLPIAGEKAKPLKILSNSTKDIFFWIQIEGVK